MQAAAPNPKPNPMPPPAAPSAAAGAKAPHNQQPSSRASSSSSSAADANPNRSHPAGAGAGGAAASTPPAPSPALNGEAGRSPLLPAPHPHLGAPPLLPPPPPPSRPLLTVAAVEAVMAAIPPPPPYGLDDLERRTVALSDGTVRTYFALPLEPPPQLRQPPPPLPAHLFAPPPPPPRPILDRWLPPPVPPLAAGLLPGPAAGLLPGPILKRKWDELPQANGGAPGESSGRGHHQQKAEERRTAKQAKVVVEAIPTGVDAKALKSAFLKMVKAINMNEADKRNYRSNGKLFQLKCPVCGRDSIDLHALLNHAYHAKNAEHRADHLGLHKAICVLMGWNYSVDPVHKNAYQTLSTGDAEANQGDLILWPPTVIIENTYKSKNDGQKESMSNKEMESKLREMGFTGADVHPLAAKDGHRSMRVKFSGDLDGLNKASQLVELFEKEGHGRAAWARIRGIVPTADGGKNPMLVKVDGTGQRTWLLYGYLATAWDLDVLDTEAKENATVKSRKELDLD
ncbi:hypothetical protein ACP70R_007504 [Stipagrostis hirtigluma subsp. patula]